MIKLKAALSKVVSAEGEKEEEEEETTARSVLYF